MLDPSTTTLPYFLRSTFASRRFLPIGSRSSQILSTAGPTKSCLVASFARSPLSTPPVSILRRCVLNFSLSGLPLNLLSREIPLSFPREAALLYPSHAQVCQACRLNLPPTAHLKIAPPCSMVTAPLSPSCAAVCSNPLPSSSWFMALLLLLLLRIISEGWMEVEEPLRLHCTCGSTPLTSSSLQGHDLTKDFQIPNQVLQEKIQEQ